MEHAETRRFFLRFGKPLVKTTGKVIVYRLGSNGEDAYDRKQSHAHDKMEDDDWPPYPGANSGKRCREGIAGMIETLVAADTARKRVWPQIPKVIAAIAGPKKATGASAAACDPATSTKEDSKGRRIEAPVTTRAAATMIAHFAWLTSISASAGVCTIRPETVAIVITKSI
jgi:hypothetical protein